MFDSFSFKYNTQTNLSIRLDQDDSSTSIEKLKNLHQQNFTAILNNPNQSVRKMIKYKIFKNLTSSIPFLKTLEINYIKTFTKIVPPTKLPTWINLR